MRKVIYVGQTSIKVRLTMNVNIVGAVEKLIKYFDPDGIAGTFTASSENDAVGILYFDILSDFVWKEGTYVMWGSAKMGDGRYIIGEPDVFDVQLQGGEI